MNHTFIYHHASLCSTGNTWLLDIIAKRQKTNSHVSGSKIQTDAWPANANLKEIPT